MSNLNGMIDGKTDIYRGAVFGNSLVYIADDY